MQGFISRNDDMPKDGEIPNYAIFDEITLPQPAKVKEIRNAIHCSRCGISSKEMRLLSCPSCVGATIYGLCNDCACMDIAPFREHVQNCGKTK